MPLVTITGNLRDHGLVVLPTEYEQRLWLKPNKGHIRAGYAMDGARVYAQLSTSGEFTAEVWSEPGAPDLYYTLCTDWLPPGQETEPTEERARGYFEWPQPIYPDTGGPIGDLVEIIVGVGLVYCAPDAPNPSVRMQLHYDTDSYNLYERVIEW